MKPLFFLIETPSKKNKEKKQQQKSPTKLAIFQMCFTPKFLNKYLVGKSRLHEVHGFVCCCEIELLIQQ